MPVCKQCTNYFKSRVKIEGKSHVISKRRYCLECVPFKSKDRLHTDIVKNSNGGKEFICIDCKKVYVYHRGKGLSTKRCGTCSTRNKRTQKKIRAIEYKGGECLVCGYNGCPQAFDFHHLDRDEKSFNISLDSNVSWERIKKELDKCVLLCATHHREVEAGYILIEDYL